MKKILLTTLFSMFALVAMSQAVGDWILHPVFGSNAKIVDTKDNVYYLSGYNVYCYDKVNDETISFSRKNNLSDTKAEKIFYDFNNRNLVIVYSNSNIDIMDRNGKVFNIPELKDAVLSYSKTINYISFVGDEMYLATDFGYMVVNTRKCEIKETHFYGRKVYAATKSGGFIVLCSTDGIYTSPADDNHFDFSSFTNVNAGQVSKVAYYINDSRFLVDTGWIMVAKVNSNGTIGYTTVAKKSARSIQSRSDGSLSLFARDFVNTSVIPPEIWQAINPFFVIVLTPIIMVIFASLSRRGKAISTPKKIAIGMFITGLAYLFLSCYSFVMGYPSANDFLAQPVAAQEAVKAGPWVLIVLYFFLTVAELFISPLGLAFVSKVAPKHLQGLCQGLWLGATAVGNLMLWVGPLMYNGMPLWQCWGVFLVVCVFSMSVMLGMVKWLERVTK